MDNDRKYLLLEIPLALTRPTEEILGRATEIGRMAGLDDDWTPECLEAAAYEILISAGGHGQVLEAGIAPRPDLAGSPLAGKLFTLEIEITATEDESLLDGTDALRPGDWPRDILSACLSVLMTPAPPLDWDVEILRARTEAPGSNHAAMERARRIRASLTLGHAMLKHANREIVEMDIPVALLATPEEIIARNRDAWSYWFEEAPPGIDDMEEVIAGALLIAKGEADLARRGLRLHPELAGSAQVGALMSLPLTVRANPCDAFIADVARLIPPDWPRSLETACLALLLSEQDPEDHAMTLIDRNRPVPSSNHDRIAHRARIEASRRLART